ncbi:MAG: cystathionine gamma-synthase family protein [Lewinellaceae bacterium]|nr:cystathionine gamma-synthase family protein [Phaeodactylibacter sp.]MCB9035757.1 cystathionine gamma-synthase family protein [Lewinellaceae bacterium]
MPYQKFKPESLMMSYGHKPGMARGAVKAPIYQTSTFAFETAEEGKDFFELAYGLREPANGEAPGMIYSRLDNPNLEILEKRLCLWDEAEACAVFASGMAAISTTVFEFLKPGDVLLYSSPLYGGTVHFITEALTRFGIQVVPFYYDQQPEAILRQLKANRQAHRVAMIYIETPANPTNTLIDIEAMSSLAKTLSTEERQVLTVVDNTYMGPLWQHPLHLGADLVLYSATKYIGGHSDVVAGAALGNKDLIARIKVLRTFFGSMASPYDAWLLTRSLETLKLRMEKQTRNAQRVARFLQQHPMVENVHYLGLLDETDGEQYRIYERQCSAPGAMLAFDIRGGEKEAFAFLNNLKLVKLAVSLGSTESLAEHPATMTHAGIPEDVMEEMGISEKLVRLSVGVENVRDLIADIEFALEKAAEMWEAEVVV